MTPMVINKTYHLYRGLVLVETLTVLIFACLLWAFIYYKPHIDLTVRSVGGIVLAIGLYLLVIYNYILRISYRIVLRDGVLIEKGIFSKKRIVPVSSVHGVMRRSYSILIDDEGIENKEIKNVIEKIRYYILLASRGKMNMYSYIPMISFVGGPKNFPTHPINPKIIESLVDIKSTIKVDNNLSDLLPGYLRKKLGLKLTIVEYVGLWIWRFVVTLLVIVITFKAYPVSLLRGSIKGGFGKPLVSQDSRAKLLDTPPIWSEAE